MCACPVSVSRSATHNWLSCHSSDLANFEPSSLYRLHRSMPGLMARAHRRAKSGGNRRLVHQFKNEAELSLGPTWTRSAPTPLQASLAGAQRHFLFIVSVMGADPRSDILVFVRKAVAICMRITQAPTTHTKGAPLSIITRTNA